MSNYQQCPLPLTFTKTQNMLLKQLSPSAHEQGKDTIQEKKRIRVVTTKTPIVKRKITLLLLVLETLAENCAIFQSANGQTF